MGRMLAVDTKQGVLMPCRALEAFRRIQGWFDRMRGDLRLNALSGIGGVQTQARTAG